ncbi:LexA family transcriptional regulator [Pseudodesulfovibrio senegalensis]|jgi:phage repressor protein C with HTH and peptisase S24 domain|uniref:Helix-turn-helix transcriptional regulator n=1 Tax=Pseudodesulfovibrio senegalensis TaxID=1721087 RepID=A0A6N6N280_9BACT|nr:S24 family peptidase [Pseudodesulfovibrio senegalensis]KAB1441768.1 helix-turn-helix transcriptional regulator [Pseudodesulfovibrio senegalensis]
MPKQKKKCDEAQRKWFEDALERIKKATGARTQVQLAEVLDVRQSSISDAKRRCSIPAEWFLKLYRSHGLDPDWLADGVEPVYINASKAKIPADTILREAPTPYGRMNSRGRVVSVSSVAGAQTESNTWAPQPLEELSIPESFFRPQLQVIRMDSANMEPVIARGAFVGIDQAQKQHPDGDIVAVHFPHQGLMIRRAYLRDGEFLLKADNPQHSDLTIPAEEMAERTLGRVIWVLQNLAPM